MNSLRRIPGDNAVDVPDVGRRDEIGEMAGVVQVAKAEEREEF